MVGAHIRQQPDLLRLKRGSHARAGHHAGVGADPLEAAIKEEEAVARPGPHKPGQRPLRAPSRHSQHRYRIGREVHVLSLEPQIDGWLVAQRAPHEPIADQLTLDRPRIARIPGDRGVWMGAVRQRVAPVLIDAPLHCPAPSRSVSHVEIRRRVTGERRLRAVTARNAVFEPARREQVGQHAVGTIELANLTEGAVGDEVDGVLAVAHRKIDREPARGAGRIEGHEIAATVRLDRPPRLEAAGVAQRPDEGWTDIRRVRDRDAEERAGPWPGGCNVAQSQLLDPAVLTPHAGPGGIDVHAALIGRADALPQHFERAAADIGAEAESVGRARQRVCGGRKQRIVDDDAIPGRTLQPERQVGARPIGTTQVRLAG